MLSNVFENATISTTIEWVGSKVATSQNIYRILKLTKSNRLWPFRQIFDFIFGFHRKKIMIFYFCGRNCEIASNLLVALRSESIQILENFWNQDFWRILEERRYRWLFRNVYLTPNNHKCKLNVKSSVSDIWKIEKVEMSFELPHKIRKNILQDDLISKR